MKGEAMDEEIGRAMLTTIRAMLETDEPTLDKFVDAFIRERGDLLERYLHPLAVRQLRAMVQGILSAAVAKGFEEVRASGWKAAKP
jgi:hypothetical protein